MKGAAREGYPKDLAGAMERGEPGRLRRQIGAFEDDVLRDLLPRLYFEGHLAAYERPGAPAGVAAQYKVERVGLEPSCMILVDPGPNLGHVGSVDRFFCSGVFEALERLVVDEKRLVLGDAHEPQLGEEAP